MATRRKTSLRSNFRLAGLAAHQAIDAAVDKALNEGQQTAKSRIAQSGYDMDPENVQRKDFPSGEGGMIYVSSDHWYYRFMEYSTVHITAKPFLRPAHRKMRAVFKQEMEDDFEKFVARRAGLRGGSSTRK